jgi:hypothetical protein
MILDHEQSLFLYKVSIPIGDFPALIQLHRKMYPGTEHLEEQGAQLIEIGFAADETRQFVRSVCSWGNYAGIADRVLNKNPMDAIRKAFQCAVQKCQDGKLCEALKEVNGLSQLGSPSFASKHLRFLWPTEAVIMDSFICTRLGYPSEVSGYQAFCADCRALATALNSHDCRNPVHGSGCWRPCDAESVLFAFIRRNK